ncbi:MAG: protein kinase [Pyrinomonadaceae bacterium]|nr:protein kinase [Pyrinomonadaceae bacterium]
MFPERWRQIEEIFLEAADLPKSRRDSFLKDKCGADAELRSEVEKLLESDESASNFIEAPVWTDSRFLNTSAKKQISNSLSNGTTDSDRDSFLGKRIGPFELTKEIGRGGMGAVYLGERVDGEFNQRVAIKLIKRGMDSDFIIRRFRHERQILASFEHPFIARLLDGGTTDDGVPYFVMEYVEDETLYNYCDSRKLGIRERLKIFQKVCSAIQYAHDKQIIHRDIKPSNILINRHGSPKLLDFGIAKILDPDLIHESVNPTASMLRMMTPDYASPEQVQGGEVMPVSDIYSLGVLLYEMLTGHRPYNFAGRALHEVAKVVCEVMPELPSRVLDRDDQLLPKYSGEISRVCTDRSAELSDLKNVLADQLDNIVMKALAKSASDRYASAKEFSEDITRYLNGTPVLAPKFNTRAAKIPTPIALSAPENSKAIAVLPFKFINLGPQSDTDDRFLGLGLADALITRLSKVRRFIVRPTSSMLAFGDGVADPIRAGNDLKVDYIIDGNIKKANDRLRVTIQLLNVADNAAVWATSIDETLTDVLTLEDTLSNKVIEVLLPQLTGSELEEFAKRGTESPEAFEHYLRGRYNFNSFTEEGLAKAFVSYHSAIAADPEYALAYAGIADYYNWLGIIGVLPPKECFPPAIEAAKKAIELDPKLSEGHASLGFSLHAGNFDWSGGEKHLLRALELNPSNTNAYVWYGLVLFTEGRFDEGLQYAKRGIELDPLTPFNHHNVGWGLYFARRYQEAIDQYRKVIAEFPTYSFGYYGISKIHRMTGDTKAALDEIETAHQLMGRSVFSLLSEAECYAIDGQTETALSKLDALVKLADERYVSPYHIALIYCNLATAEERSQNLSKEKIADYIEKAFEYLNVAIENKDAWVNWLGVEPVFDVLRDDERFDDMLEHIGYRMLFKNFSVSRTDFGASAAALKSNAHDKTTLVIEETEITESGFTADTPKVTSKRPLYAVAAAVLLISIGAIGYFVIRPMLSGPSAVLRPLSIQRLSIVVLPFKSAEGADFNLGVGLSDALTNKLGGLKGLQVFSAGTGRIVADATPAKIAADVGATFVVRGNLRKEGSQTTLTAELVNAPADRVVWREDFVAPNGDLFSLQTQLAERIWTTLGIEPLPLELQRMKKSYTQSAEAYELFLIARFQMTRRSPDNLRQAISILGTALKIDPEFAPAYVALADAYALLRLYAVDAPEDSYRLAKEYAERALSIDENLPEAHTTIAYLKFYSDRDRAGAELDFRRAIQLNPSGSQAHHWFALFFSATGKQVDAIQEIESAKQIDRNSLSVLAASGMVNFYAGNFEAAIAECNKALTIEPTFLPALKVKRWTYAAMKDLESGAATFTKEFNYGRGDLNDPSWKPIAAQAGRLGMTREDTLRLLDEAVADPFIRNNPYAFSYEAALAYNIIGETEKALDQLERAEASRSHWFNFLQVDPRFENLRKEPRFIRLLGALNADR